MRWPLQKQHHRYGIFDPHIKDLEWTFTALRLVASRRLAFIDDPTFIYYDTPDSLSRNERYIESVPLAMAQLIDTDLPANLRRHLRAKLCAAYHPRRNNGCRPYRES